MADSPDAPRPIGGTPPHLITSVTYEAMWSVYRDGIRSAGELMTKCSVSRETARKAINLGWPDRGFMPLKQRAREHDQMRVEAERKVALDKHKENTDAWYRAGKQFNRVADNAVNFSILAMQQISQLATERDANGNLRLRALTKFVRRRDRGPDGKMRYWDEEVPLSIAEAVKLGDPVLKVAAAASMFKRLWPQTTDEQKASVGPPQGLAAMTLEQLDYIIEHRQLPPGVTAEDVFGMDVPEFKKNKGKGAN
jgi:hypothetical protein